MVFLRRTRHVASIVTLYLLLASCALAQSQQSQQDSVAQTTQQQAAPDPRGTNASPLIIEVIPATKTDAETAGEQRQKEQEASDRQLTQWLAVGTVIVGVLQLVAIGFQARISKRQNQIIEKQNQIMTGQREAADKQSDYMRDGLIETRKAANAAASAADTTREQLQLAAATYVDLKGLDWTFEPMEDGRIEMITVGYKLVNMSANAARDVAISKRFCIKGQPLEDDKPFVIDVLSPGKGFFTSVTVGPLTEYQRHLLDMGALVVLFYLNAAWLNPLGHETTRRFARAVTLGPDGAKSMYLSTDGEPGRPETQDGNG